MNRHISTNFLRSITFTILLLPVTHSVIAQSQRKQNQALQQQFHSLKQKYDSLVIDKQQTLQKVIVFRDSFEINKTRYISHPFLSNSVVLIMDLRELKQFNIRPNIEHLVDTVQLIAAIDYRKKLFWKEKDLPVFSIESIQSSINPSFQLPAREENYEIWNEKISLVNTQLAENISAIDSIVDMLDDVFALREEFLFYMALSDRLSLMVEEQRTLVKQQLADLKKTPK